MGGYPLSRRKPGAGETLFVSINLPCYSQPMFVETTCRPASAESMGRRRQDEASRHRTIRLRALLRVVPSIAQMVRRTVVCRSGVSRPDCPTSEGQLGTFCGSYSQKVPWQSSMTPDKVRGGNGSSRSPTARICRHTSVCWFLPFSLSSKNGGGERSFVRSFMNQPRGQGHMQTTETASTGFINHKQAPPAPCCWFTP